MYYRYLQISSKNTACDMTAYWWKNALVNRTVASYWKYFNIKFFSTIYAVNIIQFQHLFYYRTLQILHEYNIRTRTVTTRVKKKSEMNRLRFNVIKSDAHVPTINIRRKLVCTHRLLCKVRFPDVFDSM